MENSMNSNNEFECFQNYSSSEVFVQGIAGIVNQADVAGIVKSQKLMLQRFEKTNEMLLNCNALSVGRIKAAAEDYRKHRLLLVDMKKDLSHIFTNIRSIKKKLALKYPEAFDKVEKETQKLDEGEEPEQEDEVIERTEIPNLSLKTVEIDSTVDYVAMNPKEDSSSS